MYFDEQWDPLEDRSDFLKIIDPIDGRYRVSDETTHVERRSLSFYDAVEIIRIKEPSWDPANLFIYYLRDRGNLFRLNGTSPPIHEVNAKAPVRINEENCIDYLEFFCFFVRGEEGPFLLAQTMEDTYVPKKLDEPSRAVFEGTIRPATFEGVDEPRNFLINAVVYYSNALFIANFKIMPTGMVEMLDDEPIAADLPVKIDAPVS